MRKAKTVTEWAYRIEEQWYRYVRRLFRVASVRPPIVGHEAHWKHSGLSRRGPDTQGGRPVRQGTMT